MSKTEGKLKFYSMISDTTIKYLFKNKETRRILERIIRDLTGIDLSKYKLINNELNTANIIKDYRLDLLFEKDNNIVLIEMNKEVDNYTNNKNYSYLYRVAGNMYKEGEEYEKKKYATLINFNNSKFPIEGEKGILTYEFMNDEYKLKVKGIKSIEIYLENYKGICYDKENELEMLLSLFTASSYEEMRKIAKDNEEALILVDEIEKLNKEKYYGMLYNVEEEQKKLENSARLAGYHEGIEQGIEQGSILTKEEIAKSLLEQNIDIEVISKSTGLTKDEIENL